MYLSLLPGVSIKTRPLTPFHTHFDAHFNVWSSKLVVIVGIVGRSASLNAADGKCEMSIQAG